MGETTAYLPPAVYAALVQALLGAAAASTLALCAQAALRVRVRVRIPPLPPTVAATLSALGATLALSAPPAGAEPRPGAGVGRFPPTEAPPPWHRGSGFSPPRPLPAGRESLSRAHPALHGRRQAEGPARRLFPRLRDSDPPNRAKRAPRCKTYVVLPGDTLWDIAAAVLETDDPRRVAAYWPRIHRANRDSIPDPNLIHPGQILRLPEERSARRSRAQEERSARRSRERDECAG